MAVFKGAGVAIVTPFFEDGTVNYNKLDELLDYQIDNGTDSIIICGTTGESATLSEEEHADVIRHTVEYVDHRIPVVAGTGSNSTETAIMLSKGAEAAGADAVLAVTPYYNKATQKGLIRHFGETAKAVDIPVIMYNVPSRTGCNIQPATCAEIVKTYDNVVGVKEASGDISQIEKIMELTDGDIDLYSGNDDQILPLLALGGIGVISVLSNVAPRQTHDICQAFFDGDIALAQKLQRKAGPLIAQLFSEVNPIPVKKALNLMGFEVGPLRLPMTELEPEHEVQLVKAMKEYGIL